MSIPQWFLFLNHLFFYYKIRTIQLNNLHQYIVSLTNKVKEKINRKKEKKNVTKKQTENS